jgi:hypothetical protein
MANQGGNVPPLGGGNAPPPAGAGGSNHSTGTNSPAGGGQTPPLNNQANAAGGAGVVLAQVAAALAQPPIGGAAVAQPVGGANPPMALAPPAAPPAGAANPPAAGAVPPPAAMAPLIPPPVGGVAGGAAAVGPPAAVAGAAAPLAAAPGIAAGGAPVGPVVPPLLPPAVAPVAPPPPFPVLPPAAGLPNPPHGGGPLPGVAVPGIYPLGAPGAHAAAPPPGLPHPAYTHGAAIGEKSIRIRTFSSAKPTDWMIFRAYFCNITALWGFSDARKRAELFSAMDGEAARVVQEIDIQTLDFDQMLRAYDEHFVTRAGSELAETEFLSAKQLPDEAILTWHARARELFLRAYPGHSTAGELGRHLRRVFIFGLSNRKVSEYVWDKRPTQYDQCLTWAQEKYSSVKLYQHASSNGGIYALQAPPQRPPLSGGGNRDTCYLCKQAGHFMRECPSLSSVKPDVASVRTPARRNNYGFASASSANTRKAGNSSASRAPRAGGGGGRSQGQAGAHRRTALLSGGAGKPGITRRVNALDATPEVELGESNDSGNEAGDV